MPVMQSKGQVEAQIAAAFTTFEREQMGRGPSEVRARIVDDMIVIRLKDVLTPAERRLTEDPNSRYLLKGVRTRLIENSRSLLDQVIENLTGVAVVSLHSDLSIRTGERVVVFTLAENLEARFQR